MAALQCALLLVAALTTTQPGDQRRPRDPQALTPQALPTFDVVLARIKRADALVSAMAWKAENRIDTPSEKDVLFHTCQAAIDATDRFTNQVRMRSVRGDGGVETLDREIWFDGQSVVVVSRDQRTWMKRPEADDLFAFFGPLHFMGRASSSPRTVALSEALERGQMKEVRALPNGLLRISALTEQFGTIGLLEADVDPAMGYRVTRVAELDAVLRAPYRVFETLEWVQREGAWLPSKGRALCASVAIPKPDMETLLKAVTAAGFRKLNDWSPAQPQRLLELRRVVDAALAGKPVPTTPLAHGENRVTITYSALNAAVAITAPPAPISGYTVSDVFAGEVIYPDGSRVKEGEPAPKAPAGK